MKRLLGLLGLTCLVVLTACFYLGELASNIIALSAVILFLISLFIKKVRNKKTLPVMFLTAIFAVSLFMGYTQLYINPLRDAYDTKILPIKATRISDDYYSYGYYCYKLRCTEIGGSEANCKMLLRSKEAVFSEIGDELEFTAQLNFDYDSVVPSERIFLQTWVPRGHNIKVVPVQERPFAFYVSSLRRSLNRSIYLEMDYDTANFSSAVLLGNKHSIRPEVKGLLRDTGLSHIAVVSGLHLSVIGLMFSKALRKLTRNRYVTTSVSIIGVVCFAVLSGMGVSVIRALVMFVIFSIGNMLGRRSDSLNSIGAAALLLTLTNPYSVGDIGMLLSFAATLGIVLWASKMHNAVLSKINKVPAFTRFKRISKMINWAVGMFSCNLCATLWTMPISILVYKGFSLVSLVANLLVVPFMFVILVCIGLCVVTHYAGFLYLLTDVLSFIISAFYDYLILLCSTLRTLPFSYINAAKPYFVIWIAVTIVLILIAYVVKRKSMRVLAALLSVLFLFCASSVHHYFYRNTLTLHVPNTGSGVSVVLESTDGHAVLGAGGSASRYHNVSSVIERLNTTGKDVLVSLSGYNSENYGRNLINEFDYNTVLRYDIDNGSDTALLCESEEVFTANHFLNLWDKANVSLLPCEGKVFVYIEAGKSTVLIVPRYSDCSLLKEKYLTVDTVISQGEVNNPELLRFNTLIAPGDGKYDDESMGYLLSVAENVIRGNDITYNIDFR